MSAEETLAEAIPERWRARVRSVRVREQVATVIVDGSGLGHAQADLARHEIEGAAAGIAGVTEVRVALLADRPEKRPPRQIVAIGSGKGGVGKSTLTANLAVALARAGRQVGVVDADIYGPSQVMLLDPMRRRPEAEGNQLVPVRSEHGVSLLSMAQLIEPGKAIAWRGPMVGKALAQLLDARWGDAELLLVDLPPGTGDVQLTMMQRFKPAGAVIVTTPQDLALIDAVRALDLFRQAAIPIIGLVENMAGYVCPHCDKVSDPFGPGSEWGGAEAAAERLGEAFLGRIPLSRTIRSSSDAGDPPAGGESEEAQAFAAIAQRIADWLDHPPA